MFVNTLLALLPALALLESAAAQVTGSFSINASVPERDPSISGCVILAQFTANVDPPVLQALIPVCHGETPFPSEPSAGLAVNWPLASNVADGQALASQLLIYGQVLSEVNQTGDDMARGERVMALTADQAQYLLGRSLTWNNGLQALWDNTGNGFVLTPEGDAQAAW